MPMAHQKKFALFFQNDSDEKIPNRDGLTVFRTTIYASKQRPNEFAAPYWSTDILAEYAHNQVVIRKKKRQATVGFCGYPGFSSSEQLPLRRRLKEGLKSLYVRMPHSVTNSGILRHYHANSVVRAKAIQILQRSKQIGRNFILRDNVWGGFGHYRLPDGSFNYDLTRKTFRDYVANMFESDYILCCRGKGNYSIRLYEALCCGRIPVFINTDCALPFQDQLDWKKHCVWVESYELPLIEEKILRFHDALTDRDFCELQKQCRELYMNFISPLGYFTNFYRFFS
jgi:hypothetical protein